LRRYFFIYRNDCRFSRNAGTLIARAAIASVWLYQGLWCKVLAAAPQHQAVLAAVPLIPQQATHAALITLGLIETAIAGWVLSGKRRSAAAAVQTGLLVLMNAGGLYWAQDQLHSPGAMVTANAVLIALAWEIARKERPQ